MVHACREQLAADPGYQRFTTPPGPTKPRPLSASLPCTSPCRCEADVVEVKQIEDQERPRRDRRPPQANRPLAVIRPANW